MTLSMARFLDDDCRVRESNLRVGVAVAAAVALVAIAIPVLAASPSPSSTPVAGSPGPSAAPTVTATEPPESPATQAPSPSASAAPVASPSASLDGSATPVKPDATSRPQESAKPGKSPKPDKGAETAISLEGTVRTAVGGNGFPTYSMTVDGTTWTLSAGPPWYWGDKNPLAAYVGKSVTVVGTTRAGGTEVDVETVDGTALRAPGKPPWAGGPWVVGSSHPGWKDWMADGKPGNGHGRDTAPGQLKKASPAP
jgi:hypothetical protein